MSFTVRKRVFKTLRRAKEFAQRFADETRTVQYVYCSSGEPSFLVEVQPQKTLEDWFRETVAAVSDPHFFTKKEKSR